MKRPDLAKTFSKTSKHRTLRLGETLFKEGSKSEALFVVSSGRLWVAHINKEAVRTSTSDSERPNCKPRTSVSKTRHRSATSSNPNSSGFRE